VKAREIIGRTIVAVNQERVSTHWTGDGRELDSGWSVTSLVLDNGKRLILHAIETDVEPIVTAWVTT
jgi:hypothetical protein